MKNTVLRITTGIAAIVLIMSMCAMDSFSELPFYAGLVSAGYLLLILVANNWFEKGDE